MSKMHWPMPWSFSQLRVLRVSALRFWTSCARGPKIKEKYSLRDCVVEKGGGPFSWVVRAGEKRLGYLDCCGCWETYERLTSN
jgi:hypothetical protein